jgi:pSer/pThr/pTyr-binding forkhead associated (FHA) protein
VVSTTLNDDNPPMGFAPHSLSPSKLADLLAAERTGAPFLAYKDGSDELRLESLKDVERLTIGRGEHNGLALTWDPEVSRTHAQLEFIGGAWTLLDEGLSRNGSFVNAERVAGRRRLDDGDMIRIGRTSVLFRAPGPVFETTLAGDRAALVRITDAQRRVLVALCRPLAASGGGGVPASNRQIAQDLHLSLDGVKTHVRALFTKLGIDDLPQYSKRTELARRALDLGVVTERELQES